MFVKMAAKNYFILMKLILIFSLLVSAVKGIYDCHETAVTPLDDTELIRRSIEQLQLTCKAADACTACKSRLSIGKVLSLTRPDIVPYVFKRWCTEAMHDAGQCEMNFSPFSADKSTLGSDFILMLQSMSPEGLDGDYFCYYHESKCLERPETPEINLDTMWPPKPKSYSAPVQSGESFNVLHLGHINLQPDYAVASEANCSQSLCCSPCSANFNCPPEGYSMHVSDTKTGVASFFNSSYSRGKFEKGNYVDIFNKDAWCPAHGFGTYLCDVPPVLLNNTLRNIRAFHENLLDFEFAIVTGSAIDHRDRQFLTKNDHMSTQDLAYSAIQCHLHSIPIFPSFGDTYPKHQFAPKSHPLFSSQQWQFDFQADLMTRLGWIDSNEVNQIRYSHFGYAVVTDRGLKVISLNSKVWSTKNLYNFISTESPDRFGVWSFLVEELLDSEQNNQRVWIIGEHPPSVDSMPIASQVFLTIVRRFSPKVIAAILFGHEDEFYQVIYDTDCKETSEGAVAFALMAPPISPFQGSNPGWRYYAVDEDTFDIVNSFTFYTPLNESYVNSGAEPAWKFGYSARELLDPCETWAPEEPLWPSFWHSVSMALLNDSSIASTLEGVRRRWSPYTDCQLIDDYRDNLHCLTTSFTLDQKHDCMGSGEQNDFFEPQCLAETPRKLPPYLPPQYYEEYVESLKARAVTKHGKKFVDSVTN